MFGCLIVDDIFNMCCNDILGILFDIVECIDYGWVKGLRVI